MFNTREELVTMVKACGQEIIDRAEDLVGEAGELIDMDIWVRLRYNECPTVEVIRTHQNNNAVKVLIENAGRLHPNELEDFFNEK